MKDVLERLFQHGTLEREEARDMLKRISAGEFHPCQVSAFLAALRMRGVTVEELCGFRDALLELCIPIDLSAYDPIDLCGTGGDGKDTFNISTLSAFVTAGAGVAVAKHGNYGVSSNCGSSNVMEHLGYSFTSDSGKLERQMEKAGICFLHAPLFHPAMKEVAPIRKSLGVRTFFNMLGPMTNPSRPCKQLVGVYSLELLRLYQYIYEQGEVGYRIVHSLDGYDEVSLTGDFKLLSPGEETLLSPLSIGLTVVDPMALAGGKSVSSSAKLFTDILDGQGTREQVDVVCANAGMAIHCAKADLSLEESILTARESLESKRAKHVLKTLIES